MAKKKVAAIVKIQIPAGKATPAPPVGTALGPHGVGIMDFVKQYNAATESQVGTIIPVEITIFEDRTFTFILKTPPAPVLLRQKAGLAKGSTNPGKTIVGTVTEADIEEVAKIKMPDLNAYDLEAAKQQIRGTARSMGLKVSSVSTQFINTQHRSTGTTSPGGAHTEGDRQCQERSSQIRSRRSTVTSCSPRPRR